MAFSSEPVNGDHLTVWLVLFASGSESRNSRSGYFKVPRALNPGTSEVATFKNVYGYMLAAPNVMRAEMLFWVYSLILRLQHHPPRFLTYDFGYIRTF